VEHHHTRRSRRRAGTLAVAVGLTTAFIVLPQGVGAQVTPAETAETAAAACGDRPNDTLGDLLECVTVGAVRGYQEAFQRIADNNGGNRAAGSPGFDRSVNYVTRTLRAAGYDVDVQPFDFPFFEEITPPVFEQTAPTFQAYVDQVDFATMSHSGSGDVTAPITAVDPLLPPVGGSTSGCEASDFAGFPAGNVALIQRGTCFFIDKATNAEAAGASAVIVFNEGNAPDRVDVVFGDLGGPGVTIPVIGVTHQIGLDLIAAAATVHVKTDTLSEIRSASNVIAELQGKRERVVQVGAHLDSVPAGPGINDNGSGSAAILEVALQMARSRPINTVHFSWWGAEEAGLVGSTIYVDDLAVNDPRELARIKAYLNFDMVGSPNFARFVYDGNQSTFPEDFVPIPPGSDEIEALFEKFYSDRGLAFEDTAFDGRSDYQAFALAGIPSGGLFTGAEDIKTPEQAAIYGGTAGEAFDPCYHQACDTFGNVSREVLRQNSDAIAYATFKLAWAQELPGEAAAAAASIDAAGLARSAVHPDHLAS
jgi:Zn-dependent M28 family amino/carboxypeptidase